MRPTHVSSKDKVSEAYVTAILAFDFESSADLATQVSGSLGTELAMLSDILYYAGQDDEFQPQLSTYSATEASEAAIIALLNEGFQRIYTNSNTTEGFKLFLSAYQRSLETSNEALIRLSLFSILRSYQFEFAQTNQQFRYYLEEYSKRAERPIHRVWSILFEIYFSYQHIDPNQRKPDNSLDTVYAYLQQLTVPHQLWPLYQSLKAYSLEQQNAYEAAIEMHQRALTASEGKPYLQYIGFRSCYRLAEIFYQMEAYDKSLEYTEQAVGFRDRSDSLRSFIYIQKLRARSNEALGNYQLAYQQYKNAVDNQYTLDLKENTLKNSELEIQLRTAEKEKQLLIEQEKRNQNQNIAIGLGGGLVGVLFLSVLLYKNSKKKQQIAEQEKEIEIQKKEKILKQQELSAIDAMIAGQEKERQRLAADLHDSVGATLSAAKLQFEHLAKNKNKLDTLEPLFQKTGLLLEEAYTEVRAMAHLKNSGVIAKEGLLPAVEQLAEKASMQQTLRVEVQDFGLTERLEPSLEIAIFRMIQELVTNIIKHAQASEASISITQHESSINIIVEDNGKGFDASHFQQKSGMGLSGIERRAEHLEGTLEIDATPGKGTTVLIDIPV